MKKNILIFSAVLTIFALMALGFINSKQKATVKAEAPCNKEVSLNDAITNTMIPLKNVELVYDIGSRFGNVITKEELNKAKSYYDIFPKDLNKEIVSFHSVNVIILDENYQTVNSEKGENEMLNAAQIQLLQSAPYSSDILIKAEYKMKNKKTGKLENGGSTPHLTLIPEKQAQCSKAKEVLIAYAKENTKEFSVLVNEDELQPGKITFTITKDGKIAHATLTSTSGYTALDKKMVELVSSMPGTWEAATRSNGENVDQKFVFSFGIIGC